MGSLSGPSMAAESTEEAVSAASQSLECDIWTLNFMKTKSRRVSVQEADGSSVMSSSSLNTKKLAWQGSSLRTVIFLICARTPPAQKSQRDLSTYTFSPLSLS